MIMDRVDGRRRVLETFVVLRIAASDEILGISDAPAVIEAGRDGPKAAPVHAQTPTRRVLTPRGEVDNTRGAQSILSWQRSIEQVQIPDKAGLQHRTQARDPLGKQDAIDPILHVRIFVPRGLALHIAPDKPLHPAPGRVPPSSLAIRRP